MTYQEWQTHLTNNFDPQYYSNLLKHAKEILTDIDITNSKEVAQRINISAPKLSILRPLLEAVVNHTPVRKY
jgi:hypothetical protein